MFVIAIGLCVILFRTITSHSATVRCCRSLEIWFSVQRITFLCYRFRYQCSNYFFSSFLFQWRFFDQIFVVIFFAYSSCFDFSNRIHHLPSLNEFVTCFLIFDFHHPIPIEWIGYSLLLCWLTSYMNQTQTIVDELWNIDQFVFVKWKDDEENRKWTNIMLILSIDFNKRSHNLPLDVWLALKRKQRKWLNVLFEIYYFLCVIGANTENIGMQVDITFHSILLSFFISFFLEFCFISFL